MVFAFDGFDQRDLDSFSDWFDLPKFTPQVVGGMPSQVHGEATMDIQMVHAIAPDAKIVLANARPTVEGTPATEDRPAVRIGGPPVPGRGVEPVDRLGL